MSENEKEKEFEKSVERWKRMRARFDQRQVIKGEFELFVKFEELCYPLWGLYQQAIVGNINVPNNGSMYLELNYLDPEEESYMWSWIKGNEKWHAWNRCKGLSKLEVMNLFCSKVDEIENCLQETMEEWRDDIDPRVPEKVHESVEGKEREELIQKREQAKIERRRRDAETREAEKRLGMWDN